MKIMVDFDNTLAVRHRDVDDFLALMYLIKKNCDIKLVTTTFGNDTIEVVNGATKKVFDDLKLDYELAFGNEDAAEKIVDKIHENENITLLTLGSLNNIRKAYELDNSIADKCKIVSMGSITEDLIINGKKMDELNFSVDYKSSEVVLKNFKDISIINANNCLDYYVTLDEIDDIFQKYEYLRENAYAWFDFHSKDYKLDYIIIWDLIAAVFATDSELFSDNYKKVSFENLDTGLLVEDEDGKEINFPVLKSRLDYIKALKKVF